MKSLYTTLLTCIFILSANSQKVWSFNECVEYAIENNINLQQSLLSVEYASNTVLQNKLGMYTPNINATVTEGFNFANSVDPLTYQFVQQNTNSTTMGLFIDYSLFEGLSRYHNFKASQLELDAAQLNQTEFENNTKLLVANNYLSILLAYENLSIVQEQKQLTLKQYQNTLDLIDAGVIAQSDKYEVEAQLANDDFSIVSAENNLQNAMNQMVILLQLDPNESFTIEGIDVDQITVNNDDVSFNAVLQNALGILPNLKSAELQKEIAELQLKAAKGSLSPTLSVSGYLGTNYFSAAQQQVGSELLVRPIGFVSGSNDLVISSYEQPVFGDKSFGQQIGDNFNQNIRINLNIPIFAKWQRMIAIDNAKLNILQAETDFQIKNNTLQQDVFNALTQYKNAINQFIAGEKNQAAAAVAFDFADEKFQAGLINAFEYETAKNRLIAAEANLSQAKFEYLFRKMIVTFYETGNISL